MKKSKIDGTQLLAGIAALPFNPYFKEDIARLRRKYNIPVSELGEEEQACILGLSDFGEDQEGEGQEWERDESEEEGGESGEEVVFPTEGEEFKFIPDPEPGYKWYLEMITKYKNNSLSFYYKVFWKRGVFFPIWEVVLAAFQVRYWDSPWRAKNPCKMETLVDTEVPFELDLIGILRRYGLPLSTFYYALGYTLSGDTFDVAPHRYWFKNVRFLHHNITGEDELTVCVTLHPWDNRQAWNLCWPQVSRALKNLCRLRGISKPSTKRNTVFSFWFQIVRWGEWYHLSEIQKLGPVRALKKWEEHYPKQAGRFDLSTVTHAIKRFRQIITPAELKT